MSKMKARARKKARLAKVHAGGATTKHAPEAAADRSDANVPTGKFDAKAPPGRGLKNAVGDHVPSATMTRGSARSR
ncbi:MAG: hypothetical protein O2910_08430 [Proteobacteria bacterium]|jgi:hypothetical protein|nr:hypothetical protein [Pseudomonadota bacterium]